MTFFGTSSRGTRNNDKDLRLGPIKKRHERTSCCSKTERGMQPKSCPLIAKEVVSGQVTPPSNLARHTNVEVSATSAISHSDTILINSCANRRNTYGSFAIKWRLYSYGSTDVVLGLRRRIHKINLAILWAAYDKD